MKKTLALLCLVLFFSANAFALPDCPQKGYFEIDPSTGSFSQITPFIYCGMDVGDEIVFFAKYPVLSGGTPRAVETPLLKVTMISYGEDVLGGTGNNDAWRFGFDILNAAGNSVKYYEKTIREAGGKSGPNDSMAELSLPDGTKLFRLDFAMDSDYKYEGLKNSADGGGQVDALKVTPLEDISLIVQKLSWQPAGIPKSQALVEREAKLDEAKKIAASIPVSDPRKAEVNAAIANAESALKEDLKAEETAGKDKQAEDALAIAKNAAGITGLSQSNEGWIALNLAKLPAGIDMAKTIETIGLFSDKEMAKKIVFAKKLGSDKKTIFIKPAGLTAGLTATYYMAIQPKDASGNSLDAGGKAEIAIKNLSLENDLEVYK